MILFIIWLLLAVGWLWILIQTKRWNRMDRAATKQMFVVSVINNILLCTLLALKNVWG